MLPNGDRSVETSPRPGGGGKLSAQPAPARLAVLLRQSFEAEQGECRHAKCFCLGTGTLGEVRAAISISPSPIDY